MTTAQQDEPLDIGRVVAETGIPTSTLHVWEQKGLIRSVARKGLRRQYAPEVVHTIGVIVLCQQSGFSLAEIADLLDRNAFGNDKQLLVEKLQQLKEQRAVLDRAIDGIEHAIACDHASPMQCPGFLAHVEQALPAPAQRKTGPL